MTTRAISPYGVLSENYAALAVAIRTAGIAAGLVPDDGPELTVAQLVTLCDDLAARRAQPAPGAEPVGYRWRFLPNANWDYGAQLPWFANRPGFEWQALAPIEE